MSQRLRQLEHQRRMLVLRSERLRLEIGEEYHELHQALGGVDRVFALARGFASPGLLLPLGALLLGLVRRAHPVMWATRGLLMFSVARRLFGVARQIGWPFRRRRR